MRLVALVALVGCGGQAMHGGPIVTLRDACSADHYWNGTACQASGNAPVKLAEGKRALADFKVDEAKVALDAAAKAGPLDHETNIVLWEQRGIAAAYVDDETTAA